LLYTVGMNRRLHLKRNRAGQGTVEFALMLPIILAVLFSVIEYAYYFGAVHYTNYATFSAARAKLGNDSIGNVEDALLTGNVTSGVTLTEQTNGVRAQMPWTAQTPGFKQIMGDMGVTMEVTIGPAECQYELKQIPGVTNDPSFYSDNQLPCGS
jgi:Flp pilus assembly protein TadG